MIDNFSILLSHALIIIMFYYLLERNDLDVEDPPIPDKDYEGFESKPSASLKKHKLDSQMAANPMRPRKNKNSKNENARA